MIALIIIGNVAVSTLAVIGAIATARASEVTK